MILVFIRSLFYIVLSIGLYFILRKFFGKPKSDLEDSRNNIIIPICVFFAFFLILGTSYFGTKKPGSFFERGSYEEVFYILAYRGEQKKYAVKTPALIEASVSTDQYDNGPSYSNRHYTIISMETPRGGVLHFDSFDYPLELGKIAKALDSKGNYWGIELTNSSAESKLLK